MKLKRFITRRRMKWVGLVLSIAWLAMMTVSVWYKWGWNGATGERESWFAFGDCALYVHILQEDGTDDVLPERDPPMSRLYSGLIRTPGIKRSYFLPRASSYPGMGVMITHIELPLWMPLLLLAAPTAYLWRSDRRAKEWQCARCRYDLRGLGSGVCPECGLAKGEG